MLGNTYHAQASSKTDDKTMDDAGESPPVTPKKDDAASSSTAKGAGKAKAKAKGKGKAKKAKTEQSSESSDPSTPLSTEKLPRQDPEADAHKTKPQEKKSRKQKLNELALLAEDKDEEAEEVSTGPMFLSNLCSMT